MNTIDGEAVAAGVRPGWGGSHCVTERGPFPLYTVFSPFSEVWVTLLRTPLWSSLVVVQEAAVLIRSAFLAAFLTWRSRPRSLPEMFTCVLLLPACNWTLQLNVETAVQGWKRR